MATFVLYHGGCNDGFTAAYACMQAYPDATLVPLYRTDSATREAEVIEQCRGHDVIMVDYCWNDHAQMIALLDASESLDVLDHHKTAEPVLNALCEHADAEGTGRGHKLSVWFDETKSGAGLAYRVYIANDFDLAREAMPPLFQHAEAYDLWQFVQGDQTDRFVTAMFAREHTLANWDDAFDNPDTCYREGALLVKVRNKRAIETARTAYVGTDEILVPLGGMRIAAVECPPDLTSIVGHTLLDMHPNIQLAMMVSTDLSKGITTVSMRSTDDRADVSEIAKANGGGGHRNAAGFVIRH